MSKEANSFLVGAFVLGAGALFTLGLLLFGSGDFFDEKTKIVSFFEGSVKGLRIGAAVTFRGVKIGEVQDVQLHLSHDDGSILIPVIMAIYPKKVVEMGERPLGEGVTFRKMIEKGLRAQLDMESFVTGILAVDLDYRPNAQHSFIGAMNQYTEIPSVPSPIEQLTSTLENIPINDLVEDIRRVVIEIGDFLESKETGELANTLSETLEELTETLKSGRRLIDDVDSQIIPISEDLRAVLQQALLALKQVESTFTGTSELFREGSTGRYELHELIKSLRGASDKVKDLADYLERNPEAVIRGKR